MPVETELELRAGEPFVRVRVSFDNPAEDQRCGCTCRCRVGPTARTPRGQYAVVERAPVAEGGYGEVPLRTYPASSFAAAGGLAVLLEHVSEYELLDGRELALTVLCSTGWISRNQHPYREDPAGLEIEIPDAQMRGPWAFSFALYPYEGSGRDRRARAGGALPPAVPLVRRSRRGQELRGRAGPSIDGEGVVLTALRRRGDELEARIVNETDMTRSAVVARRPSSSVRGRSGRSAWPTTRCRRCLS